MRGPLSDADALRLPPRRAALLAAVAILAAAPLRAQDPAPVDSTVAKQLDLGAQWFRASCLECHATSLADPDFRLKWSGRTAYDLFETIRSTMPEHDPGSLTLGTYASIVAYLMKLNGMPVGTAALSSDSTALAAVRLTFVPAADRRVHPSLTETRMRLPALLCPRRHARRARPRPAARAGPGARGSASPRPRTPPPSAWATWSTPRGSSRRAAPTPTQALRHRTRAARRDDPARVHGQRLSRSALRALALHARGHRRRGVSEPARLRSGAHGQAPGRGALADDRMHRLRCVAR